MARRAGSGGHAIARAALAACLVVSSSFPAVVTASPWDLSRSLVRAAVEPAGDPAAAEALLAQADAARNRGAWDEAARLFSAAYAELPSSLVRELGETTVTFAIEAYAREAESKGDASRRAALDLIARFEADLAALPEPAPLPPAIAKKRAELEAAIVVEQPSPPPPLTEPPRGRDERATPSTTAGPAAATSWALVGVGSAAIVAGVATAVWGSRMLPIARERLEERGRDLRMPELDDAYLDENRRRGRIVMGVGAGIAIVGLPLLVWGIVRIVRAREAAAAPTAAHGGPVGRSFGARCTGAVRCPRSWSIRARARASAGI